MILIFIKLFITNNLPIIMADLTWDCNKTQLFTRKQRAV